ncbi:MATH and LRR domain-containing protein PFE0570w-like [Pieris rapae]|uniref:MATH and LRR domain-containing protein PFE0570w-like n=1 Tax=Pieris rapae TaxID=64459 RepID=UPI001E27C6B4|nr:MATH and LRR domain-containing protein PFE0570w-like [Pieris rapae]
MEVGAVKQAFNNEVINLKKNLNQAKIQTIHKLTRKAKTFTERKTPEALKLKLERKAKSAVNEVLIIKKLKPRDIARFTLTHSGKLSDYLNKSEVDQNKACARLLLHKALQEKYKMIRERFGNLSIDDLLMSRQERKKIKKDLRDKQKEKRNAKLKKETKVEKESEDIDGPNYIQHNLEVEKINVDKASEHDSSDDAEIRENEKNSSEPDLIEKGNCHTHSSNDNDSDDGNINVNNDLGKFIIPPPDDTDMSENENISSEPNLIIEEGNSPAHSSSYINSDDGKMDVGKFIRPPPDEGSIQSAQNNHSMIGNKVIQEKSYPKTQDRKLKLDKRKENKNKNINEKILNRNFKKKTEDMPQVVKVVDPFFVTSTGDNYLSLAEPRAPDEIKEVHKQGNRQYRRAVMFGHVPKIKPKKNNYEKFNQNNSKFKQNGFIDTTSDSQFNRKGKSFNNIVNESNKIEEKPEKLHPSWEAKKKHSTIVPFQGKKIVFNDS